MQKWIYILVAVTIGGTIAIQPGLNAELARRVGSPFGAGVLSVFVSFVLVSAVFLATRSTFSVSGVASMPLYLWLGGSFGVLFVVGTLWLAPALGAGLLFAAIVSGQMIVAFLIDLRGLGGIEAAALNPWRVVGVILVIAGVIAFQRA
ncbi:MAG: DMT family transporter [Bauldia sp.]